MRTATGTQEVKRFYDETGWTVRDGVFVDQQLFGATEDGPIRIELHHLHNDRVLSALSRAGEGLNLLECGCGGNPERMFLHLCARYTGVDFSDRGLDMAWRAFADIGIPHSFQAADVCALPFPDNSFDAVYSAHMIYHLVDPQAQEAALAEFLRVVRPGGMVVLLAANPWPIAFPVRFFRRVLARAPGLGRLLASLRAKPPLPYNPMSIAWMGQRLTRGGTTAVASGGIPSVGFYRNVTEFNGPGRLLWRCIRWIDVNYPRAAARIGNYVILSCLKAS